jgi:hypothetical protein
MSAVYGYLSGRAIYADSAQHLDTFPMPVKRQAVDYFVPIILSHGRKRHNSCAWWDTCSKQWSGGYDRNRWG